MTDQMICLFSVVLPNMGYVMLKWNHFAVAVVVDVVFAFDLLFSELHALTFKTFR